MPSDVGDRRRVDQVLARRAVLVGVVVFPVLHEDADDLEALLLQQPRGDRRVDAARQADDDALRAALAHPTHRKSLMTRNFRHESERPAPAGAVVVDAAHDERAAVMPHAPRRDLVVGEPQRAHDAGVERARGDRAPARRPRTRSERTLRRCPAASQR